MTALTWVLEVGEVDRFGAVRQAVSYCGLCSAQKESAGKESRGPISKKRNKHLQTVLIEAAKLAPYWGQIRGTRYKNIDNTIIISIHTSMARRARVVAPGYPHHITQRGNRRQQTFFSDKDYQSYIDLMAEWCKHFNVEIWSYCLMPNHTHLIAVPATSEGLASAIGEAHRRYARMVNFREGGRGYFRQRRLASFIMDEHHLLASARYIAQNSLQAGGEQGVRISVEFLQGISEPC